MKKAVRFPVIVRGGESTFVVIRQGGRARVVRIANFVGGTKKRNARLRNQIEAALRFWAAVARNSRVPPEAHPAVRRMFRKKSLAPFPPDELDKMTVEPFIERTQFQDEKAAADSDRSDEGGEDR